MLAVTRKPSGGDTEPSTQSPPEVEAFRRAAEAYCASVEQPGNEDYDAFVLRLRGLLADLVSAGYRLPLVEPTADVITSTSIPHERWHEHYSALQIRFREHDLYWSASDDSLSDWMNLRSHLEASLMTWPTSGAT